METGKPVISLLTVKHPDFGPLRVCDDTKNRTREGVEYIGVGQRLAIEAEDLGGITITLYMLLPLPSSIEGKPATVTLITTHDDGPYSWESTIMDGLLFRVDPDAMFPTLRRGPVCLTAAPDSAEESPEQFFSRLASLPDTPISWEKPTVTAEFLIDGDKVTIAGKFKRRSFWQWLTRQPRRLEVMEVKKGLSI